MTIITRQDYEKWENEVRAQMSAGLPLKEAVRKVWNEKKTGMLFLKHAAQRIANLSSAEAAKLVVEAINGS